MKIALIALVSFSLIACSLQPSVQPLVSEAPETKGLNVVENSGFDTFYIDKGFKNTRYHSIAFNTLALEDLDIDDTRLSLHDRNWELTDADRIRWQEMFRDKVHDVFSKTGHLTLLDSSSPDAHPEGTLKAEFAFINFTPSASKDDLQSRLGRQEVFSRSVGRLDISIAISDAVTGKPVAYIEDSREVGERDMFWLERNNRVINDHRMRIELSSWLNRLRTTLSELATS